jgi:anti-anti-sigma regulatory factor
MRWHGEAGRRHGPVDSVDGLGLHDHLCWAFDGPSDFKGAAVRFLEDGRRLGQRLMYVGDGTVRKLLGDLDGLDDAIPMIDAGALQVVPLSGVYSPGPVDPVKQLATYAGATDQALADGYSGLRVAAEVTSRVREPRTWDAHISWESLADRFMATRPLAALCCYDRSQLDRRLVADLSCVHPVARTSADLRPFRVYANENGLVLEGEVDVFNIDALDRILDLVIDGDGTLDLDRLRFADHHALLALARRRRALEERGSRLRMKGASPVVRRLSQVLSMDLSR